MTLWFVFAMMTAAAVFAVLWPLGRAPGALREGNESTVYKDQLAEIERDAAAGLIGTSEAEAARIEIGRRLLAADEAERELPVASNIRLRRAVAVAALAGLPLIAVAVYLPLGSPYLPDFPHARRAQAPAASQPLENLVAQVEAHLEKNPADGRGWSVLAPVLAKLGRFDEAIKAYRNAITHAGDSASRRADLGEAIAVGAGGVVTSEARAEFERAVALDTTDAKANYYLGIAAEQDGRASDAALIWRALLAKAPPDAPWRPVVVAALARVGGGATAPVLSDDTIAAARDMSESDRGAMIRGMVDRLATRLRQNGDDVEGWLRLVRAYMVMGERDKAKSAGADARQAVANDAERLRTLNEGLKSLGVDG
ncbi:MAG TPA: c-type cytochrome biogenesis protein CcmI [Bradyrhizobium sp.]|nr:c-type cytochrome biogenesis protein CcmI [Bradyrhizobium sp.]